MKRMMMLTAAIALMGTAAAATIDSDALIRDLSSQGFTRVVVKRGPTQVMVQAIRGQEKLDLVLDNDTGTVLTQHMARSGFTTTRRPGSTLPTGTAIS